MLEESASHGIRLYIKPIVPKRTAISIIQIPLWLPTPLYCITMYIHLSILNSNWAVT